MSYIKFKWYIYIYNTDKSINLQVCKIKFLNKIINIFLIYMLFY
jgi:hypothetical protein